MSSELQTTAKTSVEVSERIASLSPAKRALLELKLKKAMGNKLEKDIIPQRQERETAPLSFAQQRLWFLYQLEPESSYYNIPVAWRFKGSLNIGAIHRALNTIIERHEALRTTFILSDGEPIQKISPNLTIELPVTDLTADDPEAREATLKKLCDEEARWVFNLEKGPLLRCSIFRLEAEAHVMMLNIHHIISDGWSMEVFTRELWTIYDAFSGGDAYSLPELSIQYADYAYWQRKRFETKALEKQLQYWKKHLADVPAVLELPSDRPRLDVQTFKGARLSRNLPDWLMDELRTLSKANGTTLFMTLLAAFQLLLFRYTGQEDIVVGSPIAGRDRTEIENIVGFFVNTLVLRTGLGGNPTFRELLARVREIALEAFEHQELPFEKLVEELKPERSLRHNPLIQVMFVLQTRSRNSVQPTQLTVIPEYVSGFSAKFDLTLVVDINDDGFSVSTDYSTDLFESATIDRFMAQYKNLLEGIVADPDARIGIIPLMSKEELHQVLRTWNESTIVCPLPQCIHQMFEDQVARTPNNVAVTFEDKHLTFHELNTRANRMAHYLIGLGVGPEVLVGMCVERSMEMIIGLLAILKAGGAYVPLDPAYPKKHRLLILEDTQATILLTQRNLLEEIPANCARVVYLDQIDTDIALEETENLSNRANIENLAYVIYTSGSTGRPKGVMISHSAISNHLNWMNAAFPLTEKDRIVQKYSFTFDASLNEIFPPLLSGAQLILAHPEGHRDTSYLARLICDRKITVLQTVPSLLSALLEEKEFRRCTSLRRIHCGGEKLSLEIQEKVLSCFDAELYNIYGPTETTIDASFWQCRPENNHRQTIPIGHPVGGTQLYILDRYLQPTPIGVVGELFIGGNRLARGYLNQPDLTKEKFIPDPFAERCDAHLYRTGDLARFRSDGAIEYAGRIDYQVKIRGFRIELGEIEVALKEHPSVEAAVVIVREEIPGDKRVTVYLTSNQKQRPDHENLRGFLKQKLPDHMIPVAFVVLEAIPLLPNGKVNLGALPVPDMDNIRLASAYVAPRTFAEETIAGIWSEILKIDLVGIHDNFFELGGHSLLAVKIMSRVRSTFQVELPLKAFFEAPTIAGFAKKISQVQPLHAEVNKKLLLQQDRNKRMAEEEISFLPRTLSNHFQLSFAQQRLWFLHQLEPNSSFYNIPVVWHLKGTLHIEALHEALKAITGRHEALRTTFVFSEGCPWQKIAQSLSIDLPETDLSNLEPEAKEDSLQRLCDEEARWVFDLEHGPLLRCLLIRLGSNENVLLLNMHHIISDEWSMNIFSRELWNLYEGFSSGASFPLSELPIQYADYAVWQQQWLQGNILEKQLGYWRERLRGAPTVLELPTDYPRPVKQNFRGNRYSKVFSDGLLKGLKAVSQEAGATLYMTLLSAFQLLLHRYTSREDILVGSPIAGRNRVEVENLIGFFVNTIILRTDFSGNPTFRELLGQVRETALGAYEHQDLPFEKLVEELKPDRSLGHNPLVQVVFSLQNTHERITRVSQLSISHKSVNIGTAKFDLMLLMHEADKELHASLEYNSDLFDQATIIRMLRHLQTLLEGIVSDPDRAVSELPLLEESERHQILVGWNDTDTSYPKESCVHHIFELQAAQTPENVAVVFGKEQLTYSQLNARANQMAHYLRSHGVGPEKRVGICTERSLEMVVGLLGILKAGGTYVPLDPAYPLERLTFMIEDAQVEMLLTQKKLRGRLPDFAGPIVILDGEQERIGQESAENLTHAVSADQLAYVMYTSGSTGRPKGVAVVHRGIVRLVKETNYVNLSPDEVFLQFAPISFDASTFEIWGALLNGARLVIFPSYLPSLQELGKVLKRYGVTTLWLTAGLFHQMVTDHLEGLKPVRQLLAGGDVLSAPLVKKALEALKGCRVINGYGPTENTTFTCCHVMTDPRQVGNPVPIGRPIANTRVYILDDYLHPVPIGVVGELYVGGDGLARDYLNRPELTREKFIPDPFSKAPESRLYKSGDLARYRLDGTLEFFGRKDSQVKIRGFRIELGEIEAVIAGHPFIQEVVVIVREHVPGDKRIAAYVVFKAGKSMDVEPLRSYLQNKIPEYMVPSAIVTLDALPLNANGKVDRKGLPVPDRRQTTGDTENQKPRDPLEIQLTKIWEKALGVKFVGMSDNFFDLGGHSLLAIQMLSQIKKYTRKEIAVADLFKHPTVEQLANLLRSEGWSSPFALLIPFQPLGTKPPFYCIHGGATEAANLIGLEQPFYGAFPHGYFGDRIPATVEEMAAEYVREITTLQPKGPYFIGGYSFGGLLAFEIAHQLESQGRRVALLVLIDATAIRDSEEKQKTNYKYKQKQIKSSSIKSYLIRVGRYYTELKPKEKIGYILKGIWGRTVGRTWLYKKRKEYICRLCLATGIRIPQRLNKVYRHMAFIKAAQLYTPKKFNGQAVLFRAGEKENELQAFWQSQVGGNLEIHELPGGHLDIFESPQVEIFAEKLKESLERAQQNARRD